MKTGNPLLGAVRPCDLEIRVRTPWGDGAESFEFVLNSPADVAGFHHEEVAGPRIRQPEHFQKTVFAKLERLRAGRDFDGDGRRGEAVRRDLVALGQDLFLEVFAGEMGRIYRDCSDKVRTLFITSDEPWIPWEILHGGPGDDFFASRFQMGRWLSGQTAPVFEKQCRHGLFLGGFGNLKGVVDELGFLRRLWGSVAGFDGAFLENATSYDLADYLEHSHYDLLHFAGHGRHEATRAAESRLELEDGPFRVDHLSLEWAERLCASRPFVFSNACQVGRLEHSLTGLDGWAARWVRRFGCSAYLAPLWSVGDSEASRFTEVVYEQLCAGRTLGEAVLLARRDLRARNANSLSWAAYSVYGHPNMRVRFGDHRPMTEPEPAQLPSIVVPPSSTPDFSGGSAATPRGPANSTPSPLRRVPYAPARVASSGHGRQFRKTGLGMAMLAALLAALSVILASQDLPWLSGNSSPPDSSLGSQAEAPTRQDEEKEETAEDDAQTVYVPKPAPSEPEQTSSPPQTPLKARIPIQDIVPQKVVIVVMNSEAGQLDFQVAEAAEAAIYEANPDFAILIPSSVDRSWSSSLLRGDLSSLPGSGQAPWGAQWLLLATVTIDALPQALPHIEGLLLSLDAKLIDTRTSTISSRDSDSHTGTGATKATAMRQATERCLAKIINQFEKG